MTDNFEDSEQQDQGDIKSLREKAKQADYLANTNSELERKIAILEAGIDTNSALGKLFLKSYDGKLEREEIRDAASEIGLIKMETTIEEVPIGETESTYQRVSETLKRGETALHEEPHMAAIDLAYKAYEQARKEGRRADDARVEGFKKIIELAAQGDSSAIFDERAWAHRLDLEGSANP